MYQPLSGLHEPTVIDPQAPNLVGVHMTVQCVPGDLLSYQEAAQLCQRLQTLFEVQGAQVNTIASASRSSSASFSVGSATQDAEESDATDLFVEIQSREVHASNSTFLWALNVVTYTLVPAVTTSTFAQDITVRGGDGFLLSQDTLQGRMVRRFGLGVWAGNALLNRLARSPEEQIDADTAGRTLSEDMYRQLSQIVFNAHVQWRVQQDIVQGETWR